MAARLLLIIPAFNEAPSIRGVLGDVAAATIGVMMDTSMQSSLTRSYFGVRILGYNFKMVGIPDSVNVGKDPLAFDPNQMRAAYDAGRSSTSDRSPP